MLNVNRRRRENAKTDKSLCKTCIDVFVSGNGLQLNSHFFVYLQFTDYARMHGCAGLSFVLSAPIRKGGLGI